VTITAQSADGATHEFPDDTAPDVIDRVMKSYATSPEGDGALTRFAKGIPAGLVKGLGEGVEAVGAFARRATALPNLGPPIEILPDISPAVQKAEKPVLEALPKPEGVAGQFGQTTGEFVGNPLSYLGPGGVAGKALMAGAAGLGSEAAGQVAQGTRFEPAARVAGAVIGGAGAAKAADVTRAVTSPNVQAGADIARAISRDETTADELMKKLQEVRKIRPDATLADVGGENVRGIVERVAQTPGAGRTIINPALTERQQSQMGRISKDLTDLTGNNKTAVQAINETMDARKVAATPLYDRAMNFNARQSPEILAAWEAETSQGWGKQILESPDFKRSLQTEYGITDPTNAPFMRVIDAWKKEADGLVGEAVRSGNNNRARVIGEMRDRVVAAVDKANPAYQQARAAWAGPSSYMDAIEDGRNILSNKISADEVKSTIAGMSAADQEAYRIGALSAIRGKMGNDPAKMADLTKYLRSPEVKAKVAAIMPTPQAAQSWLQRLEYEVGSSELAGRSLGNSATYRRLAERQDADGVMGDLVMDALSHGAAGSVWRWFMTVPTKVKDTLRSRSDKALASTLMEPQSIGDLAKTLGKASGPSTASASALRAGGAAASALAEPLQ